MIVIIINYRKIILQIEVTSCDLLDLFYYKSNFTIHQIIINYIILLLIPNTHIKLNLSQLKYYTSIYKLYQLISS